ncbi:uncharacterized protein LOC124544727 [Schistocerca americana]|uniref:uncharacterized protein LOC124544727 n=1 Tax=Schistocerca americana TaxID=7009 RepID=UPI001F4FE7EA|nr:uncharacterized protein LOC124544727 [Schistocerca americana]
MSAVAGGASLLHTALPETRSTMSDARRVLLLVAAAAAVATGLPAVAPPPGFGWLLPHRAQIAERPPLSPPPLDPHTVFILTHGYPVHVPCLQTTGASPVQTGITAGSHRAVAKNRQTESATATATTRAAVSPAAAADATTRQQGLLSFINVPDIPCPKGQRRDPAGNCRDEW